MLSSFVRLLVSQCKIKFFKIPTLRLEFPTLILDFPVLKLVFPTLILEFQFLILCCYYDKVFFQFQSNFY